ncbi:PLDc N-terminal domain-containing protein [Sutcliffiella halmapala]|uniref:PLDc N-terminal domain-containing protein n=1 Tax=Sutcliffiella halmapala TaxID=79882 RepID=UPI000994FECB|nr:PLDc N-terminal domain-containing protein [Sutcliffiella halmapala]
MELFTIFGLIIPLFWIVSIVALFWVYGDARDKQGTNIGCLWALVVFATGPIGLIAYLIVRNNN